MAGIDPIPHVKEDVRIRRRKRPDDAVIEEAIRSRAGIVSHVAKALNVSPRTVRGWRERSPWIREVFDEVQAQTLDVAEAELLRSIKAGKTAAIIFYLKCFGKSRGYVERAEITGVDGAPLLSPEMEREIREDQIFVDRLIRDPEARRLYSEFLGRIAGPRPPVS